MKVGLGIPEERYDIVSFDAKFNIKEAIKEMNVQKQDGDANTGTAAGAEKEIDEADESKVSTDKKQ